MFFNEIIHGTQYYRAPTPLPDEWETDLANFDDFSIDAFQIRINWRWNEKREGEYEFSDIDRLLELAEKYNKKVIMKFLLECAPQYVFDKYSGTRIGPKGEQFHGGAHGAFYGGWRPCFTNPDVQKAAVKFVEKVAERYKDNKNIVLWNAWNEIRNRPVEECFCPHCRKAFGKYLKNKFKTIEKLNSFYGAAEESFENIALPATPHGYWDIYEFKKFKGSDELYKWLKFVYDAVRRYDKTRPIMAHVGVTSGMQDNLRDTCDDYRVSKAVDFWGTSVACESDMSKDGSRMYYFMLNDFLRGVDKNYFVHEIYPGYGMFRSHYDTPFDMKFKLYAALATGSKGLIYWQYRAERVGHENDSAGIMRIDGTPRPVAFETKKFGEQLKKNMKYFVGAEVEKAEIGIVFDFDSNLLSQIDDAGTARDFTFEPKEQVLYYSRSHVGMYKLFKDLNYSVDYLSTGDTEKFNDYKILYFPNYSMLDNKIIPHLEKFLQNGGIVFADEGFGMRTLNTWMQPYDIDCKPLMNAKLIERRTTKEEVIEYKGNKIKIMPYKTEYRVENAKTELAFMDGLPAIQSVKYGKGKMYLFGFSPAYTYYFTDDDNLKDLVKDILLPENLKNEEFASFKAGIMQRRLINGENEIIFIFNNTQESQSFNIIGDVILHQGEGSFENNTLTVPSMNMSYFVRKIK